MCDIPDIDIDIPVASRNGDIKIMQSIRITSRPGGCKVESAFHPSEVSKMSTRNFWELSGKK